ncbi:MAG: Uma2 family endonuclease [Defluviitaleaceae bacterium]|nr:Uma2 family endonuclease [Defluviitaleaceae bacterium]
MDMALDWLSGCIDPPRTETIGGRIYEMAGASTHHNRICGNISRIFGNYLVGKKCEVFQDGEALFLGDNHFYPDVMVVCNPDIIKDDGIYGAPDLVAEVLSPSTANRDKFIKKDLYQQHGVSEYWIVFPEEKAIEVYLLKNGIYVLDNFYSFVPKWMLRFMNEQRIAEIAHDFKTSLFDDLVINVREVFDKVIKEGE